VGVVPAINNCPEAESVWNVEMLSRLLLATKVNGPAAIGATGLVVDAPQPTKKTTISKEEINDQGCDFMGDLLNVQRLLNERRPTTLREGLIITPMRYTPIGH
jgi:hypothetical protein